MNTFFAELVMDPLPGLETLTSRSGAERWIIFGAIFAVVGVVFLWAVFIRTRRRQRKHNYNQRPSVVQSTVASVKEIKRHLHEREQQRRRRRREPGRNPTLAETGGLPPVRVEEPPAFP